MQEKFLYSSLKRSMFKRNSYKEQHSNSCPSFHGRFSTKHAAQNNHSFGRWQSLNTFLCSFYDTTRIYMYEYEAYILKQSITKDEQIGVEYNSPNNRLFLFLHFHSS